ncbi:alpha/beta fold hydrolase [Caulobacter sp. S45]|uniref:alpha/beta fold hydrolase n=1 Tax=Caulobacter sp. S45 TaxID=1641861 RepID=UPI00157765D9|nr:alpha/beta hydrolase [Caulobacter sp. S45]
MASHLHRPDGERLAYEAMAGEGRTVVWLGGFNSDMAGTKAQALAEWASQRGRAYVRFDYFGHGASSGEFVRGTISRWRADALAVIDELTTGPLILVGSSMGGWIATLAALARPERIAGVVLIAPAADMTDKLMEPELDSEARKSLATSGVWVRPSPHGPGDAISRALLEDGRAWSVLPGPVASDAPLQVLQGGADADVPWTHALALAQAWRGDDVVFTLVRDGDHRLSRPQDLTRLIAAVETLS